MPNLQIVYDFLDPVHASRSKPFARKASSTFRISDYDILPVLFCWLLAAAVPVLLSLLMPWLDEETPEADLLADPRSLDEHPMTKLPDSTMAVAINLVVFIHAFFLRFEIGSACH